MTKATTSFRVSGKCFLVAHGPSPFTTHAQISVMYCLGTLVLDRLVSTPHLRIPNAYSTGVGAATSHEEGGAGTTWDRASKAEWAGHGAPEMRSGFILGRSVLYEQATYEVRTLSYRNPGYAQIALTRL